MQWYEMEACINGLEKKRRDEWEQTRSICHVIAQVNSTKKLDPKEVLPLVWDKGEKRDTAISNEDIERLKAKAKNLEKILKNE